MRSHMCINSRNRMQILLLRTTGIEPPASPALESKGEPCSIEKKEIAL
jgi:hypothetical protein